MKVAVVRRRKALCTAGKRSARRDVLRVEIDGANGMEVDARHSHAEHNDSVEIEELPRAVLVQQVEHIVVTIVFLD